MADDIIGPPLPEIISRKEAIARGLKRYFTGKPCPHGHVTERYTRDKSCIICKERKRTAYDAANRLCLNEKRKARYAADPAKGRAAAARYYRDNLEKSRKANAERYARNAAHCRQYARDYYKIHTERILALAVAYRAANPEIIAAQCRNRRARKNAAGGKHTAADIHRIYQSQNGKCACCKQKVGQVYEVDHIQPLSKGGSNAARNLQILCPTCNARKHARDPIDHMQSLGFLL